MFPVILWALKQLQKLWERSAQKKYHPMACLGIYSPKHYDCHWPSLGQATNQVFIHLVLVDLFSVNLLLLRANLLQNHKDRTCERLTQEKGISVRIIYMKNCIHITVKKKKCIPKLVGKVDNFTCVSAVSLQAYRLPMDKCDREIVCLLCLPGWAIRSHLNFYKQRPATKMGFL